MDAMTLLRQGPVVPVIVIEDAALAVDMAHALVAGGIRVLEVTLRTPAALAAIRRIRDEVPDAIVGAGTLRTRAHVEACADAGALFGISPGLTSELAAAARASHLTFIPGISTASEAMRAEDEGFPVLKLFPAEAVGGAKLLKSLASPFPNLRFCPTGGIDLAHPVVAELGEVQISGGVERHPRNLVQRGLGGGPVVTRIAGLAVPGKRGDSSRG